MDYQLSHNGYKLLLLNDYPFLPEFMSSIHSEWKSVDEQEIKQLFTARCSLLDIMNYGIEIAFIHTLSFVKQISAKWLTTLRSLL